MRGPLCAYSISLRLSVSFVPRIFVTCACVCAFVGVLNLYDGYKNYVRLHPECGVGRVGLLWR